MTAPDYDDEDLDDGQDDDTTVNLDRKRIRSLERDAKQFRKANEELAQIKRENAFIKAGINPDTDPKLKYFMSGYDGEITAEAIRSAAETAGFLTPNTANLEQAAAADRVAAASAGTGTVAKDDPIERLRAADREGGKEAVLAQIRADGHNIL